MGRVIVVGTSHVSEESIVKVKKAFLGLMPDVVAVELDNRRLEGLIAEESGNAKKISSRELIRTVGLFGFLFASVGRSIQQKIGGILNMKPGADMLSAVRLAQEHQKRVALIDRDIVITLRRFSKFFGWRERLRMFWDIIASPFSKRFRFDISKIPEKKLIRFLLSLLRERYPGAYKVLVEERNLYMARAVHRIRLDHPDWSILVVVGAGHEEELSKLLVQWEGKAADV